MNTTANYPKDQRKWFDIYVFLCICDVIARDVQTKPRRKTLVESEAHFFAWI